jgi:hypothetical protein
LFKKIDMKVGSAKLPIGNALQANVLLKRNDVGNGTILGRSQLLRRDGLLDEKLLARLEQRRGPQETANMICPKRGGRTVVHGWRPKNSDNAYFAITLAEACLKPVSL